jgi:hypothetical protein
MLVTGYSSFSVLLGTKDIGAPVQWDTDAGGDTGQVDV